MTTYYRQEYLHALPARTAGPLFDVVTVPAFAAANPVSDAPTVVAEYGLNNAIPFSIRRPFMPLLDDDTYAVAVRSVNASGGVSRYVLYQPDAMELLFPAYAGHTLQPSSVIEIWANPDDAVAVASGDLSITSNTATFANSCGLCLYLSEVDTTPTPLVPPTPVTTGDCDMLWVYNIPAMLLVSSPTWTFMGTMNSYGSDGIESGWVRLLKSDPVAATLVSNGDSILETDDGLSFAIRTWTNP